jgi:dynein heavy chain 2
MSIRETFNELDSFASNAVLTLYAHQNSTGNEVKLIKDWRSVLNQVSECTLTLQTVKNAEFFTSDLVEKSTLWENRLSQLDSILSLLNSVQRKWISLEPIYTKGDTGMFTDYTFSPASRDYQDILRVITNDPHVMRLLHITGLQTRLKTIDQTFMACQKKLQTFMEQSRVRFPRFYFLADDDLLLILAGKVEVNQSALLKKLFNNAICKINLEAKFITGVESPEGEVVTLRQKVFLESDSGASGVESWLRSLENQMKSSLKDLFFESLSENDQTIKASMWELPSQILSLVHWVYFTQRTEDSIRRHNLAELKSEYGKQLSSLTGQKLNFENIVLNIKVKSLILDTIHFLSVIEELLSNDIRDPEDWIWEKQLRFYANKRKSDGLLQMKMGNACFEYSFEYLGCFGSAKLVHTPLTDKCYLTLTQGIENSNFTSFLNHKKIMFQPWKWV